MLLLLLWMLLLLLLLGDTGGTTVCCGVDVAAVAAAGSSIPAAGRIGLLAGTEVSSASNSITDSVARVAGGVAARGGDAAFLSGESGLIAD